MANNSGKVVGNDPVAYASPSSRLFGVNKKQRAIHVEAARKRARLYLIKEVMEARRRRQEEHEQG